ncbi:MAG: hypothetical protein HUU29_04955 [Planctomycetaceae bacterium]|nr:hypothetical protein [Planctomycetaceae bacterium]
MKKLSTAEMISCSGSGGTWFHVVRANDGVAIVRSSDDWVFKKWSGVNVPFGGVGSLMAPTSESWD